MRVVIIGGGFIGKQVFKNLNNSNKVKKCVLIPRKVIDLTKQKSINQLKLKLKPKDIIFFTAAKAPVKNNYMLLQNIKIATNFCEAVKDIKNLTFYYLSSDAVYKDSKKLLTEDSITQPDSLHGIMHLSREIIFRNCFKKNLSFLRPTLVYGLNEPHNGYGPNSFFRKAIRNQSIRLFGKGEELRDHISINDVSKIIALIIIKKKIGVFNIVTGKRISFYDIAKSIIKITSSKSKIEFVKRQGPIPHNGFRIFNNTKLMSIIKKYKFHSLKNTFLNN